MSNKFKLYEKLILFYLINLFFLSLTIPFFQYLNIIYVKLILFIVIILIWFSFSNVLNFNIENIGLLEILFFTTTSIFIVSNFFINFSENFNIESILSISTYFISLIIFFFILGKNLRLNDHKFDIFTDIIFYSSVFMTFISLLYFYIGYHFIDTYSNTTAGLFGHPNTTSMFYTIAVPVLIYKYFEKKISLPAFIVLITLYITVLLFTLSRAGYIGVGVGILIYTFYRSRTLFIFVLLITLLVALTIVMDFATSKVDSILSRTLLISAAISIITESQKSILWGYGPVNAIDIFQREKLFYGDEPVSNPHNLFLMLSMQFGVLFTLFLTVSMITLIIKGMFLKFKNKRFTEDQRLGLCLTIVISLCIQNFLEDVLVNPKYFFMSIFMVFAGYIFYSIRLKEILHDANHPSHEESHLVK